MGGGGGGGFRALVRREVKDHITSVAADEITDHTPADTELLSGTSLPRDQVGQDVSDT